MAIGRLLGDNWLVATGYVDAGLVEDARRAVKALAEHHNADGRCRLRPPAGLGESAKHTGAEIPEAYFKCEKQATEWAIAHMRQRGSVARLFEEPDDDFPDMRVPGEDYTYAAYVIAVPSLLARLEDEGRDRETAATSSGAQHSHAADAPSHSTDGKTSQADRCPMCGRPVKANWVVCPDAACGAILQRRCPACGEDVEPGWPKCPVCRSSLPS